MKLIMNHVKNNDKIIKEPFAIEYGWEKRIALFLGGQAISLFGSSLVQYAIMWYITLKTQSGTMMSISIIMGFLPIFILSPFAGVWADRYNRKAIIVLADSLIALSTLISAVLFYQGLGSIWLLFFLSAVRAVGTSFQVPAVRAFLPQLVPQEQLTKVNAVNESLQSFINLLSPMLSGVLLTAASIEVIFLLDVITAIAGISLLVFFCVVPVHEKASAKQTVSYFRDLKEGFRYIIQHGYVKKFFLFCGILSILSVPAQFLTPVQVARNYGNDVWRLTAIEMVFSIGMICGGFGMASWGGFKNRIHTMALAGVCMGASTLLLGLIRGFWVYLLLMGLFGLVLPAFTIISAVLLQEKVTDCYRGRVFGVMTMITNGMLPLGMLIFGPLADFAKIEWLLIGTGVMIAIVSTFLSADKTLLEAGKTS